MTFFFLSFVEFTLIFNLLAYLFTPCIHTTTQSLGCSNRFANVKIAVNSISCFFQAHSKTNIEAHRSADIYSLGVILWELLKRESLSTFLGLKEEGEIRKEILYGGNIFSTSCKNNKNKRASRSACMETKISLKQLDRTNIDNSSGDSSTNSNNMDVGSGPNNNDNLISKPRVRYCSTSFWPKALAVLNECDRNGNKCDGSLYSSQIIECLRDCLRFESEQRPDIKTVRFRLRPLHKGM